VSDIVVGKIANPYQAVVVRAGDDYVALEVDYDLDWDCEKCPFDTTVLLAPAGAERLAEMVNRAAVKARGIAQFVAGFPKGGSL
jgi:hypothetical protein